MPLYPPQTRGTVQEAADYWGVSPKTIRRWIAGSLIHAERVGPKLIRVDLDSLETRTLGGAA